MDKPAAMRDEQGYQSWFRRLKRRGSIDHTGAIYNAKKIRKKLPAPVTPRPSAASPLPASRPPVAPVRHGNGAGDSGMGNKNPFNFRYHRSMGGEEAERILRDYERQSAERREQRESTQTFQGDFSSQNIES